MNNQGHMGFIQYINLEETLLKRFQVGEWF